MTTPKKHSTSETGYDILFNELVQLNVAVEEIGSDYDPPSATPDIFAAALINKENITLPIMDAWRLADASEHEMQIERYNGFHLMPLFMIRIVAMMITYAADPKLIKDARSVIRSIRGIKKYVTKAQKAKLAQQAAEAGNETATKLKRSVSQLSFVSRAGKFAKLIKFLYQIPGYDPKEADLKIPALETFITDLNALNKSEGKIAKKAKKARAARDKALFNSKTGVTTLGKRAKNYIKSAFGGPDSSEYALVKHLKFLDLSKKN
jgi:hypothetical protein